MSFNVHVPRRHSSARAAIPPAPPLPPERVSTQASKSRVGFLDRIFGTRKPSEKPAGLTAQELKGQLLYTPNYGHVQSQAASHRTGLRLRALDINQGRTHVVLAGGRILKTVKVDQASCIEDVNIRNAAVNYPRDSHSQLSSHQHHVGPRQQIPDISVLQRETFDIEDVAWSNGRWSQQVATAAANGKVILYDLERPGVQVGRLHEHNRQVHKVDFSPVEGQLLLSASQDGTVRLWDLRTLGHVMKCESRDTFPGRSDGVRHTKWSPISSLSFALATDNGTVQRWDTRQTRAPTLRIPAHTATCSSIDWHPDGRHLASAGNDKNVKVWDLLGDRKQKPLVSLRTPYSIQNVRWRPPCYVSVGNDELVKQCTHLATSYKSSPVVHVWDLRRSYIPFKEFHHSLNNGTTDMLWHSRDLLWTVGLEGEFTQSDVRYLPKTLDRRPLSAASVSQDGGMAMFSQRRVLRCVVGVDEDDKALEARRTREEHSRISGTRATPTDLGDDSLDENFLSTSSQRRHQIRTSNAKKRSPLGSTPPSYEDFARPVVRFDQAMRRGDITRPDQSAHYGVFPFPGNRSRLGIGAFELAIPSSNEPTATTGASNTSDAVLSRHILNLNRVGRYEEAETLEVLRYFLLEDLRNKITHSREQQSISEAPSSHSSANSSSAHIPLNEDSKYGESRNEARVSSLARALQAVDDGRSGSGAPTPLARPLPDAGSWGSRPSTPTLDLTFGDLDSSPEHSRADVASYRPQRATGTGHADTVLSLANDQRFPNDQQPSTQLYARVSHSFESTEDETSGSDQARSSEDLPFFPTSIGSAKMASAHGSFAEGILQNPGHSLSSHIDEDELPRKTSAAAPTVTTAPPSVESQASSLKKGSDQSELVGQAKHTLGSPTSPSRAQTTPHRSKMSQETVQHALGDTTHLQSTGIPWKDTTSAQVNDAGNMEYMQSISMLKELLNHYCEAGNAAFAVQIFTSVGPLLRATVQHIADLQVASGNMRCAAESLEHSTGVSSTQLESLLMTYHDALQANNAFIQAAEIRCIAYPAFSPVYDVALDSPTLSFSGSTRCGLCILPDSPYSLPKSVSKSDGPMTSYPDVTTDPSMCDILGSPRALSQSWPDAPADRNMVAICAECGHILHFACAEKWFGDEDNWGVCPVDGCLCACVPGHWADECQQIRREETKKREEEDKAIKRNGSVTKDLREVGESAAAVRAVAALRD